MGPAITCVGVLWRTRYITIVAILIHWAANKSGGVFCNLANGLHFASKPLMLNVFWFKLNFKFGSWKVRSELSLTYKYWSVELSPHLQFASALEITGIELAFNCWSQIVVVVRFRINTRCKGLTKDFNRSSFAIHEERPCWFRLQDAYPTILSDAKYKYANEHYNCYCHLV